MANDKVLHCSKDENVKHIEFCNIYCGEETVEESLNSLKPFINEIKLSRVLSVSPQVLALNQMISQITEEFFVELDSDMILFPNALDRIRQAIEKHKHDPNWHTILFRLYDTFTEKDILALKVMRSKIFKQFLFKDVPTPDVEHFTRLTEAGYTCITDYLPTNPIGKHVLKGNKTCYLKYRDVYHTLRYHKKEWDSSVFMGGNTVKEKSWNHFMYFLTKYIKSDDDDYLAAIAGMVDGLTTMPFSSKNNNVQITIDKDGCLDKYYQYYNKGII